MTNLAVTIPPDQIRAGGEPVFPELRNRLEFHYRSVLLDLVNEREAYGVAKYGQTLMSDDGRDTPTEIVNELLDALAYLTKWSMQRPDDHILKYTLLRAMHLTVDIVEMIGEVEVAP
jgi:hypothetical protein